MAGETLIHIEGNLTADPELRFTPSGAAVANFTVASTPRTFDKQTNEWKDGETLFMRCNAWRDLGENVAESLSRGMRVIVIGNLKQRSYETKEGEKRTIVELDVVEVGPSLKSATATVKRTQRTGQQQAPQQQAPQQQGGWGQQRADDPWAAHPPAQPHPGAQRPPQQGAGWTNPPSYDEPPF